MMDKRTLIAFGLIGLIFVSWPFVSMWLSPRQAKPVAVDTVASQNSRTPDSIRGVRADTSGDDAATTPERADLPAALQSIGDAPNSYVVIESPLYRAVLNRRGGLLARMHLKRYNAWYGDPVQLVSDSVGFPGVLAVRYADPSGRVINTSTFAFEIDAPDSTYIDEGDSAVVTARLRLPGAAAVDTADGAAPDSNAVAGVIEKRFVFRGDSYGIDFDVLLSEMAEEIGDGRYELLWENGLEFQEYNSVGESSSAGARVSIADDVTEIDGSDDFNIVETETLSGPLEWAAIKVKYFAAALIPDQPIDANVTVQSVTMPLDSAGRVESYDLIVALPYAGASTEHNFTLFTGPLDFQVVSDYGLGSLIDLGFAFIVRPIAEWVMLPLFRLIHMGIPNYGFVIIVFALLIRLALWPLSIPQIRSSRRMQLLQPEITKIREQHKDDPQAQQMETMKLYQQYGINPVGGCAPLLLQLPILYALWSALQSSIELRQADFMLWIHDLSVPDIIVDLPFSLPILGDELSGLALIMGATLFIQQKMMISDPRQKALVYVMPIVLTLAFNHFPSGLNLYYLVFNLLSIGQQVYLTKFSKNELTLEELRQQAKNKKKGRFSKMMEEAQRMAEAQRNVKAGDDARKRVIDGRTPVEPGKKSKK